MIINICLAYSITRTTYAAHATLCPISEVDSLVPTRKPDARFVADYQDEIRPHDLHRDLALRWRFAVQFEPKRRPRGKIVRLTCRKL